MKNFNYHQPTKILFGTGRIEEVGEVVKGFGKKCLLVTTPAVPATEAQFQRVKDIITAAGVELVHFDGVIPNPTTETSAAGSKMARELGAEVIVGLGGGSSMDAAKAIAVEASHEGSAWDYLFYKKEPTEKTLPMVAISTTSGTGSQVTQVSVITNPAERDKSALYHPRCFPEVCIVDPQLMLTVPKQVTAHTGFDVFCHAFESTINPGTGAYMELLAWEAITIVANTLPSLLDDLRNIKLREKMAWADTLAGLCIASAGVTLPHGMGMAIGGMYPHVAHGESLAIVYPACTKFTYCNAEAQYATMARIFNPGLEEVSDAEAAEKSVGEITKFLEKAGMYKKLKDMKMPESEIPALSKQCMVLPDYKGNPRVATEDEMLELVKESYY
ncbi:MAG: iron-containing alcohol dehydrogenase [Bacteroidales bacterium]|nr:iron-containing alcohol dehydrogenase [Bacteroidales bacterium]